MTEFFWPHLWLFVALIGIAMVDEHSRRIPNRTLLALVLLWVGWLPVWAQGTASEADISLFYRAILWRVGMAAGILAAMGALALWRPESMGMGDVKLMSVLALYFSPLDAVIVLDLAFLLTFVRGVVRRVRTKRKTGLPFAPQVAVAVSLVLFLESALFRL